MPQDRVGQGGRPPFPLTPPSVRIRTRRFQKRLIHLETITDSTDTSPISANRILLRVRTTNLYPEFHQQPRLLYADIKASTCENPALRMFLYLVLGRFHCRQKITRSRRRIHMSSTLANVIVSAVL